ncbi:MAG TPA: histidine kinase dimerization/phospho-acceptor domain-containing protein [Gemmataceae bacterium]
MNPGPAEHASTVRELAHEVRNSLGAILAAVRALQKAQGDPAVAGQMLQIIETNVREATEGVNRLVQLWPPPPGATGAEPSPPAGIAEGGRNHQRPPA